MDISWFFKNLDNLFKREKDRIKFSESIIYLDKEQLSDLYGSLTGLKGRPTIESQKISGEFKLNIGISTGTESSVSKSIEISDSYLLQAILTKLEEYPHVNNKDEIKKHTKQRVWLKGVFRNSRFNYPTPKLELLSNEVDCLLYINEGFLSSVYRPLILIGTKFSERCKLLGYIHSFEEKEDLDDLSEETTFYYIIKITPIFMLKMT